MKKYLTVFDLDGTLLSSQHRYRTDKTGLKIDLQHWRDNSTPEKIALDSLLPLAQLYKKLLKDKNCIVAIATARVVCGASLKSIKTLLGMPDLILSRNGDNDTRGGAYFKIEAARLLQIKNDFEEVYFYDDNMQYLADFKSAYPTAKTTHIPSKQGH